MLYSFGVLLGLSHASPLHCPVRVLALSQCTTFDEWGMARGTKNNGG